MVFSERPRKRRISIWVPYLNSNNFDPSPRHFPQTNLKGRQLKVHLLPISRDIAILFAAMLHIVRYLFRDDSTPPNWCDTSPWHFRSHRRICAIAHFAIYRAITVRYTIITSGMARVRLADLNGPKWTPKWTKMDHFGPFWSREC